MIIDKNLQESYYRNGREYALYVNKHRMIPDFRDGFIPVQRRIIYAAFHKSKATNFIKCATIVGDTMGYYHPHGDSSIEGALYQLVNWFNTKIPLFEGEGTFGNTNGDSAAASRYTTARFTEFTKEVILDELTKTKDVIDWEMTYDNRHMEPKYLPVKVPLLLINGSSNIAVGDVVHTPTHNLCEVIDETIKLIKNPNHKVVLVPDHCQRCEIINTDWEAISSKGNGTYQSRGIIEIDEYNGIKKQYRGLPCLRIRSCPNETYLSSVTDKLEELVKNNKIYGIQDIEENSSIDNMDFYIILKNGVDPNFIKEALYKNTSMQKSKKVNMMVNDCMDTKTPVKRFTYTKYLQEWLQFRKVTKHRYLVNIIRTNATRVNVLENLIWSIETGVAKKAIDIIRASSKAKDDKDLEKILINKLKINDIQAEFFLATPTKKFADCYLKEYKEECKKLKAVISKAQEGVLDPKKLDQMIINELLYIKEKYGTPRTTTIIKNAKDEVPAGLFNVVVDKTNHRVFKYPGDKSNISDPNSVLIVCDNRETLYLFDEIGKVYPLPVSKIPFTGPSTKNGVDIRLLNKYINARINTVLIGDRIKSCVNGRIVVVSNQGYIKKMDTYDFESIPNSGLVYAKAEDGVKYVCHIVNELICNQYQYGFIIAAGNKAITVDVSEIPLLKRNSRGNMTIPNTTIQGIWIVDMTKPYIVIGTSKGYINKVEQSVIRLGRGKKGNKIINLTKDDFIVDLVACDDKDNIGIYCLPGKPDLVTQVKISDIKIGSSISSGQRITIGRGKNFCGFGLNK